MGGGKIKKEYLIKIMRTKWSKNYGDYSYSN